MSGYGQAGKEQVQVMVGKLLSLHDRVEENAGDALAIALCHAHHLSSKIALAAGALSR